MPPHRHVAACLLSAALLFAAAGVGTPPAPRGPSNESAPAAHEPAAAPNAALVYWPHWSMISDDAAEKLRAAYAGEQHTDPAWTPDDDLTDLVEDLEPAVLGLMRAAAIPACDFGLERELGVRLMMPHLSAMRLNARLLAIDARWHAAAGRPDEAAERLAAILKLGEHTAANGKIISSQVGIEIAAIAARTATAITESGGLTPDARNRIADAADAMRQHQDPFHILAVLQNEEQLLTRLTVEQPEEIVYIAESIGFRGRERLSGLPGRSPEERQRMAAGLTQAYNHLREARAAGRTVGPDEVRDRSGDDGWGPVAALVIPTTAKALAQEAQIRKELETLTELLRSDHEQPEDPR